VSRKPRTLPAQARTSGAGAETLASAAYRAIKEDIIGGVLVPREWLRIDALRERYGAGASPIREALNRLSAEGLVLQQDQRGFVVADLDQADLAEVIFTRCALNEIMLPAALSKGDVTWEERVVLAHYHLAKTPPFRSDGRPNPDYLARHREFHMAMLAACGSRWLLDVSAKLFDWTQRYQNLAMRHDLVATRDVAREHDELVEAILARDARRAIDLLNAHVRETGRLAVASRQEVKQD
jgi:GntR family transcriptional regulator, carbon starvation induced regulator